MTIDEIAGVQSALDEICEKVAALLDRYGAENADD